MKNNVRRVLKIARNWVGEEEKEDRRFEHFAYHHLNKLMMEILTNRTGSMRPSYTWGVLHGAYLAKALGIPRISVAEFGVAGGSGLIALENAAEKVEERLGVKVDVYGFDTGRGLPKPTDYRDLPNLYSEGSFAMDFNVLKPRLKRAQLVLGLIKDTMPGFIESKPAPMAFMSVDVDLYSSTMDVFKLLEADTGLLLPRIYLYFDDIMGFTCADFNGERLAVAEFTSTHEKRKISPIYGLRHFVPKPFADKMWPEMIYMAHILDHPLYNENDQMVLTKVLSLQPERPRELQKA